MTPFEVYALPYMDDESLQLERLDIAWHQPHKVMFSDGYDAVEVDDVGDQQTGYLALQPGDFVVPNVEGAIEAGHSENKYSHYTYGHKFGKPELCGWFPVQAIMLPRTRSTASNESAVLFPETLGSGEGLLVDPAKDPTKEPSARDPDKGLVEG